MKACRKCGIIRRVSDFTADRRNKDGLHIYCQPCRREAANQKYAEAPARGLTLGAFKAIKDRAKRRGIEFLFTYDEWLAWWEKALAERGGERGKGTDKLSMCRIGDVGPYAPGNVFAGTPKENSAGGAPPRKGYVGWLRGRTGADHPQAKAIETPAGWFPSVTEAAQHYGMTCHRLRRRLASGRLSGDATQG